ncbi:MAG: hypothetical protein AABY10_02480 [Nanoarchaeota archaeon]
MKNKKLEQRREAVYDSFIAGISGGLVVGLPIFAYDFLLNKGHSVITSIITFIISFLFLFFIAKYQIDKKFS